MARVKITAAGIRSAPEHVRAVKRPVAVTVDFARAPGALESLEGRQQHAAGDALITGVAGERWPVARAIFDAKYAPAGGQAPGEDGAYVARARPVRALAVETPFEVEPQPGALPLFGAPGDWAIDYGDGSLGVVAAALFERLYEVQDEDA